MKKMNTDFIIFCLLSIFIILSLIVGYVMEKMLFG